MSSTDSPGAHGEPHPGPGHSSGCARPGCNHPVALHSNGKTPCRAFACRAGGPAECQACGGGGCDACKDGAVMLPCPGFVSSREESLLAS